MIKRTEWTPALRKQWNETWSQPHMQAGLIELLLRLKSKPVALPPGYDALVIAAASHHQSVGHQEVFDQIEEMGKERLQQKPLPGPWTDAAMGETQQQDKK